MPQNKYALARYRLIDQCLQQQVHVKTSYIVQVCKIRLGYDISRRMIQMDIEAMKNDSFLGFYAPIEYCNKRKAYYYAYKYSISTISFSPEEVKIVFYLITYLDNKLPENYYDIFIELVQKVKKITLFDDGEINFRDFLLNCGKKLK